MRETVGPKTDPKTVAKSIKKHGDAIITEDASIRIYTSKSGLPDGEVWMAAGAGGYDPSAPMIRMTTEAALTLMSALQAATWEAR